MQSGVRDSAGDADTEAWEELLSTPPTSMAGVRELLAYILRDAARRVFPCQTMRRMDFLR